MPQSTPSYLLSPPVQKSAPLPRTPRKILDTNLVLTPNGKFFNDIGDENDTDLNIITDKSSAFDSATGLKMCPEKEVTITKVERDVSAVKRNEGQCCESDEEPGLLDSVTIGSHKTRRVTDCKDRGCRFCPSYDPVYASAIHGNYWLISLSFYLLSLLLECIIWV